MDQRRSVSTQSAVVLDQASLHVGAFKLTRRWIFEWTDATGVLVIAVPEVGDGEISHRGV